MPTAVKGGEAAAQALANTLATYINAEIDAISAAWGDASTVPLPHVASANIYTLRRAQLPAEGVALVVSVLGGEQTLNHATEWGQLAHHLEVAVVCQSDDLYVLEAQVDRYLTAVWQVVMKHPGLDATVATVVGCDPVRYGRSETYPHPKLPLMVLGGAWEVVVYVEQVTA